MSFNEYQTEANKTASNKSISTSASWVSYLGLGLNGESGEVAEILKKHMRDGTEINMEDLSKELGDVLWYISGLCSAFGFSLEEIAQKNIKKLRERHGETYKSPISS